MKSISLHRNLQLDAFCGEFESNWNSGQRPRIEAILATADPEMRTALLAELIALEYELRTASGESVELLEYQQRFPQDELAVATAVLRISSANAFRPVASVRDRHESSLESNQLQLGEQLGAGGMGVVFRCRDARLERELAVKILAEDLQSRRPAVRRFVREAQVCARLEHPGVVPIHEMGWLGERPYFTMKLVTGQSFAALLAARQGPSDDFPRMLGVFGRVCETMAYAHKHGVVHRDLKPANVMLGEFGEVYVIDWGLAKLLGEPGEPPADQGETNDPGLDAVGTIFGTVVGTPEYMSPEQAAGGALGVDQRTDVYALGAVLCEILTGEPPRADEGPEALEACTADRALVDLARRCLAKEPADRPFDAGEVSQCVTDYQRGVEERLRMTELELARRDERRRRRRLLAALTASLLLLLTSLAAGGVWVARLDEARRQAQSQRQQEENQRRQEQEQRRQEQEQLRQEEEQNRQTVKRRLHKDLDVADKLYKSGPLDWRKDPIRRTRVLELARRAETLVETGLVEPADVELVVALRHRIEADDADARLLGRLDQIRLERTEWKPLAHSTSGFQTGPMCQKAFSIYGLEIPATDPDVAVEKILGRPPHVAEACVFPLECWSLLLSPSAPETAWIDTVLDQIDNDTWRRKTRQACRDKDWSEVERLLRMAAGKRLSVDTANLVSMRLIYDEQFALAHELLRAAQLHHPGDFWINHYLAITSSRLPEPKLEEAVRFYTAALAIRETADVYQSLAESLVELGRYDEAEQALRSAARLEPNRVTP